MCDALHVSALDVPEQSGGVSDEASGEQMAAVTCPFPWEGVLVGDSGVPPAVKMQRVRLSGMVGGGVGPLLASLTQR